LEGTQLLRSFGAFARACFLVVKRPSNLPLTRNSQGLILSEFDFSVVMMFLMILIRLVLFGWLVLVGVGWC